MAPHVGLPKTRNLYRVAGMHGTSCRLCFERGSNRGFGRVHLPKMVPRILIAGLVRNKGICSMGIIYGLIVPTDPQYE